MSTPRSATAVATGALLTLAATVVAASGCTPTSSGSSAGGVGTSSGASSSSGARGSSSGGSGSSGGASSSGASSSGGVTTACVGTGSKAGKQPLDILIMLDRSPSMADVPGSASASKWQAVSSAIDTFLGQPLDATSVGLAYFPIAATPSWNDPTSFTGVSCKAADYAAPVVEIGPIAGTGARIRASITSQDPKQQNGTPTSAALQGALEHARSWAVQAGNAGHAVVVLLATDGEPTTCETDLAKIDAVAAAGPGGTPALRTFVIGVGDLKANLDGIAKAGGTTAAFIVDPDGNVGAQFLEALNEIRNQAVGCSYAIPAAPSGQALDFDRVNVAYQPGGAGTAIEFARVAGASACGTRPDAWHYDAPPSSTTAPAGIVLCPSTCDTVKGDAAASVQLVLGCRSTGEW